MTDLNLPHNWRPRDYQLPLWNYLMGGGKRAIEIAHRRWGKDDVMLHAIAIAAHERVATYWTCLPEYEQGRKALWDAVNVHTGKRRIDEAFPPELRESKDETRMFLRFKSGSTWQIVGSDRYDSTVGSGPAGIVYSEWALSNPASWAYHRPILEENDGWAAFITTPRGRNHAQSMFDYAMRSSHWYAQLSSIEDTNALSPEVIAETKAEYIALYGEDIGRAQFEQEYLCSFNAAVMGAFYAREMLNVRNEQRVVEIEPDWDQPVHRAWDIGVRDDTTIWWFQPNGAQLFVLDCYSANSVGVDHYAEIIKSKPYRDGIDYVPHDAKVREWGSGRTRVETMIDLQLHPEVVASVGKLDGINALRTVLPLCVFHPRTELGMTALEQYRREWDTEKKAFKPEEVHDWTSHFADAARYMALAYRPYLAMMAARSRRPKAPQKFFPRQLIIPPPDERPARGIRL